MTIESDDDDDDRRDVLRILQWRLAAQGSKSGSRGVDGQRWHEARGHAAWLRGARELLARQVRAAVVHLRVMWDVERITASGVGAKLWEVETIWLIWQLSHTMDRDRRDRKRVILGPEPEASLQRVTVPPEMMSSSTEAAMGQSAWAKVGKGEGVSEGGGQRVAEADDEATGTESVRAIEIARGKEKETKATTGGSGRSVEGTRPICVPTAAPEWGRSVGERRMGQGRVTWRRQGRRSEGSESSFLAQPESILAHHEPGLTCLIWSWPNRALAEQLSPGCPAPWLSSRWLSLAQLKMAQLGWLSRFEPSHGNTTATAQNLSQHGAFPRHTLHMIGLSLTTGKHEWPDVDLLVEDRLPGRVEDLDVGVEIYRHCVTEVRELKGLFKDAKE
ncbi:hypothetical protein EDB86DRAFT_2832634 [Lactarius hatsudake]|nr:hypothetical protein EDB86DRAFT_2832634 [Lactarius hatsudake]